MRSIGILICLVACASAAAEERLPRLIYNNDGDDLKWTAYGHDTLWTPAGKPIPLRPLESAEQFFDLRMTALRKTQVDCLSFCGNFGVPVWEFPKKRIAPLGNDPLAPIVDFAHGGNMQCWISLRMNDWHHTVFPWEHLWDDFRRDNRRLLLDASEDEWQKTLQGVGGVRNERLPIRPHDRWRFLYDYAHAEVRDHYLAQLRTACERYDLDGVELDWLRYSIFFARGEEQRHLETMSAFVQEMKRVVDEAGKKRGRKIILAMRVPDSPDLAKKLGLDVERWAKEGWVDVLIAGHGHTFASSPVKMWVAIGHENGVAVYGCITRSHLKYADLGRPETIRAAAATLWHAGVDGIYLFNYYLPAEYERLREIGDAATLTGLDKEFFVDERLDFEHFGRSIVFGPLPHVFSGRKESERANFILPVADDLSKAKAISLRLRWKSAPDAKHVVVSINGKRTRATKTGNTFVCPGDAIFNGDNRILVTLDSAAGRRELVGVTVPVRYSGR